MVSIDAARPRRCARPCARAPQLAGGGREFDSLVASPAFTGLTRPLPLFQHVYSGGTSVASHVALSCVPVQNAAIAWSRAQPKKPWCKFGMR